MSESTSPRSQETFVAVGAPSNNAHTTVPEDMIGVWANMELRRHLPEPIDFTCWGSRPSHKKEWHIEVAFTASDGRTKILREPVEKFPSQDLVCQFLLLY